MPRRLFTAALACAALAPACFDLDVDDDAPRPRPRPPVARGDASIVWSNPEGDGVVESVVLEPQHLARFFAQPRICDRTTSFGDTVIRTVEHRGRVLTMEPGTLAGCFELRDQRTLRPGDVVRITVMNERSQQLSFDATLPAYPVDHPITHQALSAWRDGDMTWSATPTIGLVGVSDRGETMRYAGVPSALDWDPEALEPQSPLVLALEPDPHAPRAMWLGTAATGVSWFDPGPRALDDSDDVWVHGQPIDVERPMAGELAQTAVALAPDPTRPDTAWVATLNGLFRAQKGDQTIHFTRIADGAALAVDVDARGRVWAGFSRETELAVFDPDLEQTVILPGPGGALLRFDPEHDTRTWAMLDEGAVTAILADARGAWIGTPLGLVRADEQLVITAAPVVFPDLAIVDLAASADGFWLAARSECAIDEGRLLHATFDGDSLAAIADHSDAGFGERDFNALRVLADGTVLISTLVPGLNPLVADLQSASGCDLPDPLTRSADLYELLPEGGPPRRFGAP